MRKSKLCAVGDLSPNTKIKCLGKIYYVTKRFDDKVIVAHRRNGILELPYSHIVKVIES